MREIELIYIEVMNETEQLFVFETTFNKNKYAVPVIINMILPVTSQDEQLSNVILALVNMTRKDAAGAVAVNENSK